MSARGRTAGPRPAAAAGWWPTSCRAANRTSISKDSESIASRGAAPPSLASPRRLRDQLRAQHLAVVRAWQARNEADRPWLLVAGKPRPAMFHQLALGDRHAGLGHHEGGHGFAPLGVGQADHRHLGDGGMQHDDVLDLLRDDGAAPGSDHLLEPADDVEIAAVVELADVAGMQPAAAECRAGGRLVAPIARRHVAAADQHLAGSAGANSVLRLRN